MDIIIKGKRQGKTTELIKRASKDWLYIICHSQREAHRIQDVAQKMNLKIPFPLTYDEFIKAQYHGRGINGFLIDNIEMLLNHMTWAVPIKAITLTDFENDNIY